MSLKKERQSFSLEEKLTIIQAFDDSELNQTEFASLMNISPSTFRTILKKRREIEENAVTGGIKRKKVRSGKHKALENELLDWYLQSVSASLPINGPVLQEKAHEIAFKLGITDFRGSTGWLGRFKQRHGIVFSNKSNSEAVDASVVQSWKKDQFPKLIRGYGPCDIYNAGEFGLFYKATPDNYQEKAYPNEKCLEGQLSEDRLTVFVCTNSTGSDKLKPLVIGKSAKPRCFENVKSFPCNYSCQSHAWMTSDIFLKWLHCWNEELKLTNRKVVLFVDECRAHPMVDLSNIMLAILPHEYKDQLQPFDKGIYTSIKQQYRKRIFLQYYQMKEQGQSPKTICIHDALHYLAAAWSDIDPKHIYDSFRKTWFSLTNDDDCVIIEEENYEEDRMEGSAISDLSSFYNMDDGLTVCETKSVNDSKDKLSQKHKSRSNSDFDEPMKIPRSSEVIDALRTIKCYFSSVSNVSDTIFQHIYSLEKSVITFSFPELSESNSVNSLSAGPSKLEHE